MLRSDGGVLSCCGLYPFPANLFAFMFVLLLLLLFTAQLLAPALLFAAEGRLRRALLCRCIGGLCNERYTRIAIARGKCRRR